MRSNYFQRRIFSLLILFIAAPYILVYSGFVTDTALVNALVLASYIIALAISLGAGRQAFNDRLTFKSYPSSKKLAPVTNFIVSAIITLLLLLLLISVTVQGLTLGDWTTIFVFALASHIILFLSGNLAEIIGRLPDSEINKGDNTVATGIVSSLIILCITTSLYGRTSTYTVLVAIIALTAAAIFFIYTANRHFLKEL